MTEFEVRGKGTLEDVGAYDVLGTVKIEQSQNNAEQSRTIKFKQKFVRSVKQIQFTGCINADFDSIKGRFQQVFSEG